MVSSATGFVVTGSSADFEADLDPGPGVDLIEATTYLSRFSF